MRNKYVKRDPNQAFSGQQRSPSAIDGELDRLSQLQNNWDHEGASPIVSVDIVSLAGSPEFTLAHLPPDAGLVQFNSGKSA